MPTPSFFWTLLVVLMLAVVPAGAAEGDKSAEGPVYELRIYTAAEGKLDALNERFRSHTARLFKRHGIENVGYWVAADAPKSETTLIYLLQHASREAADKSWQAFRNDPEWQKVAAESKARDGDLLAAKIDATYLVPTDYSPKITSPAPDKLYELRVYRAAPGKFESLHSRFRDHTDGFFARHGMKSLGYWSATEGTRAGDVLIYILEYPDREAAAASWQAFGQDPGWQAARKASEVNGRLLAERPESIYMSPTDYSPTR